MADGVDDEAEVSMEPVWLILSEYIFSMGAFAWGGEGYAYQRSQKVHCHGARRSKIDMASGIQVMLTVEREARRTKILILKGRLATIKWFLEAENSVRSCAKGNE